MKKAILASAAILCAATAARATDTPLQNGSFENLAVPTGFTQTINNWVPTFAATSAANGLPANQYSGIFNTFGTKFVAGAVPNGTAFAALTNLGYGTVTLTSDADNLGFVAGTNPNFQLIDRNLAFRYVYITNDPAGQATHDQFFVRVDFFNGSGIGATSIGSTGNILVAGSGTLNDTGAGFSPFANNGNNATTQFNNSNGTGVDTFNLFNVDVSAFFGQFARVSFIVDNNSTTINTNGNGLGVSGVVLDNVLLNPEPSAVALFGLGALGLGGFAWRRRAAKKPAA
jgi:hypothetical protein